MAEIDDYGGPFRLGLMSNDFSQQCSPEVIHVWQVARPGTAEAWWNTGKKKFGSQAANLCDLRAWLTVSKCVDLSYAKRATSSDCRQPSAIIIAGV